MDLRKVSCKSTPRFVGAKLNNLTRLLSGILFCLFGSGLPHYHEAQTYILFFNSLAESPNSRPPNPLSHALLIGCDGSEAPKQLL